MRRRIGWSDTRGAFGVLVLRTFLSHPPSLGLFYCWMWTILDYSLGLWFQLDTSFVVLVWSWSNALVMVLNGDWFSLSNAMLWALVTTNWLELWCSGMRRHHLFSGPSLPSRTVWSAVPVSSFFEVFGRSASTHSRICESGVKRENPQLCWWLLIGFPKLLVLWKAWQGQAGLSCVSLSVFICS